MNNTLLRRIKDTIDNYRLEVDYDEKEDPAKRYIKIYVLDELLITDDAQIEKEDEYTQRIRVINTFLKAVNKQIAFISNDLKQPLKKDLQYNLIEKIWEDCLPASHVKIMAMYEDKVYAIRPSIGINGNLGFVPVCFSEAKKEWVPLDSGFFSDYDACFKYFVLNNPLHFYFDSNAKDLLKNKVDNIKLINTVKAEQKEKIEVKVNSYVKSKAHYKKLAKKIKFHKQIVTLSSDLEYNEHGLFYNNFGYVAKINKSLYSIIDITGRLHGHTKTAMEAKIIVIRLSQLQTMSNDELNIFVNDLIKNPYL